VPRGQVFVLAAYLLLNAFDFGGKKLHRAAALGADHVMMIAPLVLVFVTRDAVVERHLAGQPTLGQQLQSAIHGGEPDALILFLDQAGQFVGGKMVARIEKSAQDGVALFRALQADALQMGMEHFFHIAHHLARDRQLIVWFR
jgi:hypothetical protein